MILYFNILVNIVCDTLLRPFRSESPWPMMAVVSVLTAVLALLVFKRFSSQDAIRRSKSVMIARMFELLLFKDDFVVGFGAIGRLVRANLVYQKKLLKPLVILFIPLLILLIQISCWFSMSPLKPGDRSLIKVIFGEGISIDDVEVSLATSDGLEIETRGLRIPDLNEIDWRFIAKHNGNEWIDINVAGSAIRKQVMVSDKIEKVSEKRVRSGVWEKLTNPVEHPLNPEGPVRFVKVTFQQRDLLFGNWKMHWLVAFSVLSLFFGMVLKRPFNVEL